MEVKDYFKKKEEIYNEVKEEYELARRNNEKKAMKIDYSRFSINDYEDPRDLLSDLRDYIDDIDSQEDIYYVTHTIEDETEDGIADLCVHSTWYTHYSDKEFEKLIENITKTRLKKFIGIELKPKTASYLLIPDCKFVELWIDGKIDWETLQIMTYKNCEI